MVSRRLFAHAEKGLWLTNELWWLLDLQASSLITYTGTIDRIVIMRQKLCFPSIDLRRHRVANI